jgi:hypothetical protein
MIPPTVRAEAVVRDDLLLNSTDLNAYEDSIKKQLASQLADSLIDKVEFREYRDPNYHQKVIRAELIAMSWQEFQANYGNMTQRRGICDGTMAIMQNGQWKVLGNEPMVKPVLDNNLEKSYNKKSAVDYLTERMRNS